MVLLVGESRVCQADSDKPRLVRDQACPEATMNTTIADAPAVPMTKIWRTIRDYILWSYERGTVQYDVMVTLILLFVFLSPYWINFHDKPVERNPHPTGVVVTPDAGGGFIYQIDGAAVTGTDDAAIRGNSCCASSSLSPAKSASPSTKLYAIVRGAC